MELNSDMIGIQGVLKNCLMKTGEFVKINFRGGNEAHVHYVTTEIMTFLTSRDLMHDKKPNKNSTHQLNEIVFFLGLNTVFKNTSDINSYSYLRNIIPPLSKCILANVCYELGLIEQYGYLIENLPIEVTEELLDQMIECLRKSKPNDHLDNAIVLLKAVHNKLLKIPKTKQYEQFPDEITRVVNIILQNILTLSSEEVERMSKINIYKHMGFTLLRLFELSLYSEEERTELQSFLACLLNTTSSLVKMVTLNIFCSWAEIDYKDQPLQTVIAGQAYRVMNKYGNNKLASELVSLLGSIARKPKTLSELILEADVATIIKKVDGEDEANRKLWFKALLNTPVFHNSKVIECIERWWRLCDENDVNRLLTVPLPPNPTERQRIVKCASNLTTDALLRTLRIYFHRNKFLWAEDTEQKLISFFNHTHQALSEDELKEALLMLLQNSRLFFKHFYRQALMNCSEVVQVFELVKDIAKIDRIGMETLLQVLDENPPNVQNTRNYIKVIETMLAHEYYTWDHIVSDVLLGLMVKYKAKEDGLEEFCCCLQILKTFDTQRCELPREVEMYEYILMCASENRCSFLEFVSLKQEITECCIEYLSNRCDRLREVEGKKEYFSESSKTTDDPWALYYTSRFLNDNDLNFVDCLLPNFNLSLYNDGKSDENFTALLKVLPRCVSMEWKMLLKEIEERCRFPTTLNAVTNIVILLCEFTESQKTNRGENADNMIMGLKFCLQNFGRFLGLDSRSGQDQILAVNSVCRVLRYIPEILRHTEGMSLIHILPEDTLRNLATDKEFIARIVLIGDKQLCKVLAQKVLGS